MYPTYLCPLNIYVIISEWHTYRDHMKQRSAPTPQCLPVPDLSKIRWYQRLVEIVTLWMCCVQVQVRFQ
jgi:hypothetical protein